MNPAPAPAQPYRRAARLLLATFLVYGALVATHRGEFWPFSIYQMFSSAGRTWTRVLLRDVSDQPGADLAAQRTVSIEDLPGHSLPLGELGLAQSQNDLSVFVEHTDTWTDARRRALADLFRGHVQTGQQVLLYRVRGSRGDGGGVEVLAAPVALIRPDTVMVQSR